MSPLVKLAIDSLADLAIDALGLKRRSSRPPGADRAAGELTHRDAEIQADAARQAGPPCEAAPAGWFCSRVKGHSGPCAAYPKTLRPPPRK